MLTVFDNFHVAFAGYLTQRTLLTLEVINGTLVQDLHATGYSNSRGFLFMHFPIAQTMMKTELTSSRIMTGYTTMMMLHYFVL